MPAAGEHPSKNLTRAIVRANKRRVWTKEARMKARITTKRQMRNKRQRFLAGSANRGKATWGKGKRYSRAHRLAISRAVKRSEKCKQVLIKILPIIQARAKACPNGLEKSMIAILDKLNLKYEFQKIIGKYIPDFTIGRLIIEVDGYWHDKAKDRRRDKYLSDRGYKVIRFQDNFVRREPEYVSRIISIFISLEGS